MRHLYFLYSCMCGLCMAALSTEKNFNVSAEYRRGNLILTRTGFSNRAIYILMTHLHTQWTKLVDEQFIIEDILQYKSPTIQVVEYNPARFFYSINVHVVKSNEGDTKNVSWTVDAFPSSEFYEISHTYETLPTPILRSSVDNISIFDASKYAYPCKPFDFGSISFEIRNITTRDAGYYTGCTVKNESWCGGGIILVVQGNPTKPVITGNVTLKTGKNASVTCYSESTSAPSHYKRFPPLSYLWYINDILTRETTGNIYRFIMTKGYIQSHISCQAKETLMSAKSERLQITPLYGPDPEDIKISPWINDTVTLHDGDVFGPYLCTADCNPPCNIQWRYMKPSGDFINVTSEGYASMTLPEQRVDRSRQKLFLCVAKGVDGKQETVTINLDVQHLSTPKVYINGLASANVSNIPENASLHLACFVEGNPVPMVTISRGKAKQIMMKSMGYWLNYTSIKETQCDDTDVYRCEGTSKENPSKFKTFTINIVCKPRFDERLQFKSTYHVEHLPTVVTVDVPIISYPKPMWVKWFGAVSTEAFHTKISGRSEVFQHWVSSTIPVYNASFLGNYTLYGDGIELASIRIKELKSSLAESVLLQQVVWISVGTLAVLSILSIVILIIWNSKNTSVTSFGRQSTQPPGDSQTLNTEDEAISGINLEPLGRHEYSDDEYITMANEKLGESHMKKSCQFMADYRNNSRCPENLYENFNSTL